MFSLVICRFKIGDIVVEVVNMGVYHERNLRYFFILSAKFFYIVMVKCEQVIIKNEHFDPLVVAEQVLDLIDDLVNPKMTHIVQLGDTALKVLAIGRYHAMVKTIGAGERAAPG
jgi:hypothetical protein